MTITVGQIVQNNQEDVPARDNIAAVAEEIFKLATAFDGFTAQMRRAYDLNAHERLALAALWAHGPLAMNELGSWIPLSRAAVTTLIDRMEKNGLVRRCRDENDRRRTVVELTSDATERMVPVLEPWKADLGVIVRKLGEDNWRLIYEFLLSLRKLSDSHSAQLRQMSDKEIQRLAIRKETS